MPARKSFRTKLKAIKCLATDVDGVLTDGHIYLGGENEWRRSFFIRDGMGIILLREKGYKTAFITSSRSEDIRKRAENLKINFFYDDAKNKAVAFAALLEQSGLEAREVLYVGDDVIDLPIFAKCGLSAAPSDAHPEVKKSADIVTNATG